MGIELIYEADGRECCHGFSMATWDTLKALEGRLPEAVSTMIDVPEIGDIVPVPLDRLREAVLAIDRHLRDEPEALPPVYTFKREYLELNGTRHEVDTDFNTGSMSGFRLPDDEHYYGIEAGLDRLVLRKWLVQPDGRPAWVGRRDLRGELELMTSTYGRIEFRAFAEKVELREGLQSILDFLSTVKGPEVCKKISG